LPFFRFVFSGGGKSTVVQLIERFYDVTSGSITLDGNDIRSLNVQWLRSQIGLVSQEPKLFALSIRENIAIGCPGATSEQIEEAARKANAHDFIVSFRDGYDTQCGDQGAQLSGGTSRFMKSKSPKVDSRLIGMRGFGSPK
jgi:ATP-binding cassette subfamily B (MDR/TAP) protein 1